MNKKKNICNFCGRSESEVRLMITGLNGYICEDCARQAYDIVCAQGYGPEGAADNGRKSSIHCHNAAMTAFIKSALCSEEL